MNGVIIGKFYPPHRGHKFLIDFALRTVDHLTVIVCDHPTHEISAGLRAAWLRESHPSATVVVTPDDLPDEPAPWARRTIDILGVKPDIVFTSEDYGEGYAREMGCRHQLVDIDRIAVPISGTCIRRAPLVNLDFLEPCVRAYFVKRVVLIGVESTGKTTLAEKLAKHYETIWVPEFGREYCLTKSGDWSSEEFVTIAQEQQSRENAAARSANKILFCDTNAFATSIWHRRYMSNDSKAVNQIAENDVADLYLLTMPDFPFVQDGTRDGEHVRHEMHEWFVERLSVQSAPVVELRGDQAKRLHLAKQSIALYLGLTSTVTT
jgi:NadR type nicotinamide-nucleotide adenylyltransferase